MFSHYVNARDDHDDITIAVTMLAFTFAMQHIPTRSKHDTKHNRPYSPQAIQSYAEPMARAQSERHDI